MTANALICLGVLLGAPAGWLLGCLFTWDEANDMLERYKRYRDARDGRRNAKHYAGY